MAKNMPDAAVPLGSKKEVDTGPEHGPMAIEPLPTMVSPPRSTPPRR